MSVLVRPRAGTDEAASEDRQLVEALRNGEEDVLAELQRGLQAALLRLARVYVSDEMLAQDVVQETWLGVLRGLPRFEGRSSLRTWIFSILVRRAKTSAQRERRVVPFSALRETFDGAAEPVEQIWDTATGRTTAFVAAFTAQHEVDSPEERALADETSKLVLAEVEALPAGQRDVVRLRAVEGWTADEVCAALGISDVNQRVLLHRARARLRQALEQHFSVA